MKSNRLQYIAGIAFTALTLTSCDDYLDRRPDNQITEEEVFTRYERATGLVNDVWATARELEKPICYYFHFGSASATDECEAQPGVENNFTQNFNTGAWSSYDPLTDHWRAAFFAIRQLNVFLEGIHTYNTPDNPSNPGELKMRIGEAYFLRAYLHYILMKEFGEIPYMTHVFVPGETMNYPQESVHTIVRKIEEDCKTAYDLVGARYGKDHRQFGRCDKGACLGLIAVSKYIAASPLWNGASDRYHYTGKRVHEEEYTYDEQRWKDAAMAAKAVIDYAPNGKAYELYEKYSDSDYRLGRGSFELNYQNLVYKRLANMFGHDTPENDEIFDKETVFFTTYFKDTAWQGDIYPPSRRGGSRMQPLQEQVDEYECIVEKNGQKYGYSIFSEEAKGKASAELMAKYDRKGDHQFYEDTDPYVNRDPRFYRDIVYHGAPYRADDVNYTQVINTAEGPDAINASNATLTGYYLRKFQMEDWRKDGGGGGGWAVTHPIWRLPEFIYIYAEGITRSEGPNKEAYDLVNKVRKRAFMAPMPPEVLTDKDLMLEYLEREWRVEFFYENKRMFRCRLFLEPIQEKELLKEVNYKSVDPKDYFNTFHESYPKTQRTANGMRPVEDPAGKIIVNNKRYKMVRFKEENRVFRNAFFLWPINRDEIRRSQGVLVQNPFWDSDAGE